ncbi:hypothetical protein ACFT5E_34725 [[Kitasatospora] papulosa]|uniref:hypothetical protein n=1 Tax=[Kitasatospora] papulosa TaxID=1464011 RepID=UPI00362FFAEC
MSERDSLALTLAVGLLIGGVLIGREILGLWPVVAVTYGPLVAIYCGPEVVRRLLIRREVWRFGRELRRADR